MSMSPGHGFAAPAGKSTVVAGSYRALWNDLDLGLTLDGFTLTSSNSGVDITADVTGETVLDTIYSGTSMQVSMTLEHWNAQAIEPMIWWQGNSNPAVYEWGLTNGVGQRHWDQACPLILYACHNTGFQVTQPSAADPSVADVSTLFTHAETTSNLNNPHLDPLDIVFPKTLLQKDSNVDIRFSYEPRFITLTLDVFPIADTVDNSPFSEVAPDNVERVNSCSNIRYFAANRGTPPT